MSDTGFTRKRLDLTITLGGGQFGDTLNDTVTLSRLRMSAELINAGGDSMGKMQLRVFGLDQHMMNRVTQIGYVGNTVRPMNAIQLAAGDDDGMSTVFIGTIYEAWADYNSAPDVAFNVISHAGGDALARPVDAISFKGVVTAQQIMQGLAASMKLQFENNGVDVSLSNPYFPGTALMQVRACAKSANIYYLVDNGILSIWNKTGSRAGDTPLISPSTGMVGYPALNSAGMMVNTIFHPDLRPGRLVQVQSSIPSACGTFTLGSISHSLSSETPDGPWFTNFQCSHVTI